MTERARAPISIVSIRIGRTDLGESSAVIDDDAITITVRATSNERPIRVALSSIDAISLNGTEVSLALRGGTRLALVSNAAAQLRDDLLVRCRVLPEVTRTLRAFGSRRGHRSTRKEAASDQQRFFAPLLEARRKAGAAGGPEPVMAAFDTAALTKSLQDTLATFAAERYAQPGPGRRALEAEIADAAEPLFVAVQALGDAAERASAALDDLRLWRIWAAQLRATFEVADRVWLALDESLDATPWR